MEQMAWRSLDMIVDDIARSLHVFSRGDQSGLMLQKEGIVS
jgi:hypothetical protein